MQGFLSPDNNDPRSAEIADTMRFVMPATLQYGNVSALRVQDILVFDIVRTSRWQRPVYFAITAGGEENRIGLRDYLELVGMAYKLVPQRRQGYYASVDEAKTRAHLFSDVQTASKEPAFGFLWRGLQDSTVTFDENQRRMLSSYRQPFLSLAMYLSNVKNKPEEMLPVLDRMEHVMPRKIHTMDFRMKSDIAMFYQMAGAEQKGIELQREVANELVAQIESGTMEPLSQYNPYVVLAQTYQGLREYDKAVEILRTLETKYGPGGGVKEFVEARVAEISSLRNVPPLMKDSAQAKTARKK
jgi:hypothetical protein